MTCLEVDELASIYVAGALLPNDEAAVRAHVASCPDHDVLLAGIEAAMAQDHPEARTRPSPALRSKILTAIGGDEPFTPARRTGRRVAGVPIAGVAVVAALVAVTFGLLAWNIKLQSSNSGDAAGTFATALHGQAGASGWMFYDDAHEAGVIAVEGLAPLPSGQTYQVWAITPGGPLSCGLLAVTQADAAFARMTGEVSRDQTIFVTVEPAGGSVRPSGPTVLTSDARR